MKNLFVLLLCFAWSGMAYATDPAPPFGIRIDTAYVTNDLHIDLEYTVLVPFGKIHLSAYTSMDDAVARQNSNVPLTLSGAAGTYKKRIPVNLPQGQITVIMILLQGVDFVNRGDSANYPFF